jgi:hypothetical protein
MDGETFHIEPNAVVIFGFRSILSMIGLVTAVVGYWMIERQWENQGSAVLRRRLTPEEEQEEQQKTTAVAAAAAEMELNPARNRDDFNHYSELPNPPSQVSKTRNRCGDDGNDDEDGVAAVAASMATAAANMMVNTTEMMICGTRDLVRVTTGNGVDGSYHPPNSAAADATTGGGDPEGQVLSAAAAQYYNGEPSNVFQARLNEAFPLPVVWLIGCGLWSLSFFLDPNMGGWRLYANGCNVSAALCALVVGFLWAFPIRTYTLERNADRKTKTCLLLAAMLLLLCIVAVADPVLGNGKLWYITFFGGT